MEECDARLKPGKEIIQASTSEIFWSNAPVLTMDAFAKIYARSLVSLDGEYIKRLIKGCKCLYIKSGILAEALLPGDCPIDSTNKDNRDCCCAIGRLKILLGRILKKSKEPPKALGTIHCK